MEQAKNKEKNSEPVFNDPKPKQEQKSMGDNQDASERYDELMKQQPSAISSDMFFGRDGESKPNDKEGRWSTPANMPSLKDRLQDQFVARSASFGGGSGAEYQAKAKETADIIYEKGQYVATGAYIKASQAKHAALDWITSMTSSSIKENH